MAKRTGEFMEMVRDLHGVVEDLENHIRRLNPDPAGRTAQGALKAIQAIVESLTDRYLIQQSENV